MGTRRRAKIEHQNPIGLSAPVERRGEHLWLKVMREDAVREQGLCCEYCKEPLPPKMATADHATPRALGGRTERKNIKACCFDCNQAKGQMTADKFKQVIRKPPPDASFRILLANSRFRIRKRELLAHKRIMGVVEFERHLEAAE